MNNTALKAEISYQPRQLELLIDNSKSSDTIDNSDYSKLVFYLGLTLILIQILDGIFTSIGIATYGIKAEGNPLLYKLMQTFDYGIVLFVTKSLAIAVIVGICYCAKFINWIHYAMFTVIGIYLSAAIFPWAWILMNS